MGFIALHVRIHWMRARIQQQTTKAATGMSSSQDHDLAGQLPVQVAVLDVELKSFEARLQQSFRWSEANLRLREYSPRLGIFVVTHIWWRQCHLDLYRIFLPGLKGALSATALAQIDAHFVEQCRRTCYEHARAMADMFAQILTLGRGVPLTDIDLPECALHCSMVLYHGLQTAGAELGFTAERVRELVGVCLRVARQATPGPACANIVS